MIQLPPLTAVMYQDNDGTHGYVVRCPELGITTQGDTIEHAREMIKEAVEGWLEVASPEQIETALSEGGHVVAMMPLEIEVATTDTPERIAA
jgi:predicted RNase H-like HicB family nuclease